jgi:SPP1 family predicted phage head-tail adaptor
MRAGELRHRITIRKPILGEPDEQGTRSRRFVDVCTVWAAIEPLTGREAQNARTFSATATHTVTIRHRDGILPTYQIRFGTRTFSIDAPPINPGERNESLIFTCSELVQ